MSRDVARVCVWPRRCAAIPMAYAFLRIGLGCVLVGTACLKGRLAIGAPSTALADVLRNDWEMMGLAECEFILGVWLICGIWPRLSRQLTIMLLCVFAVASTSKILSHERSCGCAGEITISPWYSLSFNLAALGGLVLLQPQKMAVGSDPSLVPDPKE